MIVSHRCFKLLLCSLLISGQIVSSDVLWALAPPLSGGLGQIVLAKDIESARLEAQEGRGLSALPRWNDLRVKSPCWSGAAKLTR